MLYKFFDILTSVALNGFLAIFVAAIFYIIITFAFTFAMIPVSVIAGEHIANQIMNYIISDFGFKIVYTITFISLMLDEISKLQ